MSSPTAERGVAPRARIEGRLWQTLGMLAALLVAGALLVWMVGDEALGRHLSGLWWVDEHRRFLRWCTDAGLYPLYGLFLVLLLLGWRLRQPLWLAVGRAYLFAVLGGAFVLVRVLKIGIGRLRPDATPDELPTTWWARFTDSDFHSFPSGHAADVFTGAICLAVLLPRPWMRAYALGYALLIGLTRVLLAKHWPSDVLGGAALAGLCCAVALHLSLRRLPPGTPPR